MQEKIYVGSCPLDSVQLRNASLPEQNEKHLPYMSIKLTLTLFREPPWTDQTIDDLPASFFFNDINIPCLCVVKKKIYFVLGRQLFIRPQKIS